MFKRSLSAIIAAIIAFAVVPVGVRAEETEEEIGNEEVVFSEEVDIAEPEDEERSSEGEAYAVLADDGELIFFRSNDTYTNNTTGTFTDIKGNEYTGTVYSGIETLKASVDSDIPWYRSASLIRSSKVADGQTIAPVSTAYWFSYFESLTSLDLSGFDTGNVTSMNYMFYGCSSLTSLDLSSFDTSNVTIMSGMFIECSGLTSLDLSGFDTSNVITMSFMFAGCRGLTSLDLGGFDTGSVTKMICMFSGCSALTSLNVSGFDTSCVTSMGGMFAGCISLTNLDVSGFDTSNVTNMNDMFNYCTKLTNLDLRNFDTGNVTEMGFMFYECSSLTSLDLSGFDTGNVTEMTCMFYEDSNLNTIYVSEKWNVENVTSSDRMFDGCIKLPNYDSDYTDKTRAYYGGDGYLTYKSYDDSFQFDDVQDPERYYYEPVYWAYYAKPQITKGTSETLFSPDAEVTRGQIVTFLYRAAGEPEVSADMPFTDVTEDRYFYNAVLWAASNGITTGTSADQFSPDAKCTRAQIVTFLWRYCGQPEPEGEAAFEDLREGAYYLDAVAWAAENGITTGTSATQFSPDKTCTRGQAVTFLYRAVAEK